MIPLCIVYDITCHRSGFHSCVWALYPNLYTAFTDVAVFAIFAVFVTIVALARALLTSFSTAFHWLDEFSNFSQTLQYSQFLQFSQKSQFSSGPSQSLFRQVFTDSTNFPIFRKFCNFLSCVQTWTYLPKGGKCLLKYLRKVCIFPCCCNANLSSNECDKSTNHWQSTIQRPNIWK